MRKYPSRRGDKPLELCALLDHGTPRLVRAEAFRLFRAWHPSAAFLPVKRVFAAVTRLYSGRFPGFKACSTEYHDLYHSLEVFSSSARLLDGALLAGRRIGAEGAVDLLAAALLHDAGYIQEEGDGSGTGAKFTKTHVDRSAAFTRSHARELGLDDRRAARVSRIILGTDLARQWSGLAFESEEEGFLASILAAADLLGQMADRAYLERLLFLYYEFREAGIEGYATAFDILKKTAGFYSAVKARLDGPLGGASAYARLHFARRYGEDRDLYREAIDRQMAYLHAIVADASTNFRKKLHRLDLETVERERRA